MNVIKIVALSLGLAAAASAFPVHAETPAAAPKTEAPKVEAPKADTAKPEAAKPAETKTTEPTETSKPAAMSKPMMSEADRRAKAVDCSKEADAKKLHGEARKKFRSKCKSGK